MTSEEKIDIVIRQCNRYRESGRVMGSDKAARLIALLSEDEVLKLYDHLRTDNG